MKIFSISSLSTMSVAVISAPGFLSMPVENYNNSLSLSPSPVENHNGFLLSDLTLYRACLKLQGPNFGKCFDYLFGRTTKLKKEHPVENCKVESKSLDFSIELRELGLLGYKSVKLKILDIIGNISEEHKKLLCNEVEWLRKVEGECLRGNYSKNNPLYMDVSEDKYEHVHFSLEALYAMEYVAQMNDEARDIFIKEAKHAIEYGLYSIGYINHLQELVGKHELTTTTSTTVASDMHIEDATIEANSNKQESTTSSSSLVTANSVVLEEDAAIEANSNEQESTPPPLLVTAADSTFLGHMSLLGAAVGIAGGVIALSAFVYCYGGDDSEEESGTQLTGAIGDEGNAFLSSVS